MLNEKQIEWCGHRRLQWAGALLAHNDPIDSGKRNTAIHSKNMLIEKPCSINILIELVVIRCVNKSVYNAHIHMMVCVCMYESLLVRVSWCRWIEVNVKICSVNGHMIIQKQTSLKMVLCVWKEENPWKYVVETKTTI